MSLVLRLEEPKDHRQLEELTREIPGWEGIHRDAFKVINEVLGNGESRKSCPQNPLF